MKKLAVNVRKIPTKLRISYTFIRKRLHHRYIPLALVSCLLLVAGSAAALYTHSDSFQSAKVITIPAPIIIQKTQAPQSAPAPTDTPASAQATTTPPKAIPHTTRKSTNISSRPAALICSDKQNSIYVNYETALAAENQHHTDELNDIETTHSVGGYDAIAEAAADGSTGEELYQQDLADESARHTAATTQLSNDEQAQLHATGCFGPQ